jgi:Mn2+/Fe2+ NRAMP family transporter
MRRWFALLGPGLMLAAAAVGVSHLVQSTRVGSDYGLSLAWVVVLIAILKYPAFRFALDYATATGQSLVEAYAGFGRVARAWLFFGFLVDMFIATAAVALVTAGLVISIFDLAFRGTHVALGIVLVSAILLVNGNYGRSEAIVKLLVVVFSVMTLLAALLALPDLGGGGRALFGEVRFDRALAIFVIGVMGWMPLPMTGSIFLSQWATEKRAAGGPGYDRAAALTDLRVGWILTVVVALCFVVLGTAVLFDTSRPIPANAGQFATELLGVFTAVIGGWSFPIIAAAALAVMWSTVLALMDALPRVTSRLFGSTRFRVFLGIQVAGVAAVLLALMSEFSAFIDFATGTGFVTAPAIAWYNYRAVRSLPPALQPGPAYAAWHWAGFVALFAFAIAFLVQRFDAWPFPG